MAAGKYLVSNGTARYMDEFGNFGGVKRAVVFARKVDAKKAIDLLVERWCKEQRRNFQIVHAPDHAKVNHTGDQLPKSLSTKRGRATTKTAKAAPKAAKKTTAVKACAKKTTAVKACAKKTTAVKACTKKTCKSSTKSVGKR